MNIRTMNVLVAGLAVFALTSAIGCSSSDDPMENQDAGTQQDTGTQQDAGTQQEAGADVDFTLDFTAVEHAAGGDNQYKANVHYNSVSECVYKRTDKWLSVTLAGGPNNNLTVALASFAGKGDYTATGEDSTNSSVFFKVFFTSLTTGMDDGVLTVGTWDGQKSDPCEIKVLESNLAEVQVTGSQGSGAVRMQVTCKSLGGAQLGRIDAKMAPETFAFLVSDCTVYP